MLPFITKSPYHREMPLGPVPVPVAGTLLKGHNCDVTMDVEQTAVPLIHEFLRQCAGEWAAWP